uniref:Ovule protein n=1 Tax=Heterorhabditis bacteriophora TaxID=37862 RepID=A0A1I7W6M2_HETBA
MLHYQLTQSQSELINDVTITHVSSKNSPNEKYYPLLLFSRRNLKEDDRSRDRDKINKTPAT